MCRDAVQRDGVKHGTAADVVPSAADHGLSVMLRLPIMLHDKMFICHAGSLGPSINVLMCPLAFINLPTPSQPVEPPRVPITAHRHTIPAPRTHSTAYDSRVDQPPPAPTTLARAALAVRRRRRRYPPPPPTPLMGVNCAHELFPGATSQLGPTSTSGSGLRGPLQLADMKYIVQQGR